MQSQHNYSIIVSDRSNVALISALFDPPAMPLLHELEIFFQALSDGHADHAKHCAITEVRVKSRVLRWPAGIPNVISLSKLVARGLSINTSIIFAAHRQTLGGLITRTWEVPREGIDVKHLIVDNHFVSMLLTLWSAKIWINVGDDLDVVVVLTLQHLMQID
jgi:hypothetical protein